MNIGAYLITTESQHSRCALIEKTWGSKMSNGDELYFFTDAKYNFNNYIFKLKKNIILLINKITIIYNYMEAILILLYRIQNSLPLTQNIK